MLERYGLKLVRVTLGPYGADVSLQTGERLSHVSWGPQGDAGYIWPDTVVVLPSSDGTDPDPEYVLHEGIHLVVARRQSDIEVNDEGEGLLQLERAIARYLSKADRDAVIEYQHHTAIECAYDEVEFAGRGCAVMVGDLKGRETEMKWWARGVAWCKKHGLLNEHGRPTWKQMPKKRR